MPSEFHNRQPPSCSDFPFFLQNLQIRIYKQGSQIRACPIIFGLFYAKLFHMTLLLCSAVGNQVYCYHCLTDAAYVNFIYHSFKMFAQFWLAKSTRIIHHNQSLMTKFGRISCLMRKWRQKYSLLQVHALLTKKTWGRGWVVLVVNLKNGGHFTRFKSKN